MRFRLVALIAVMLTGVVGCTSGGSNGPSGTLSTSAPTRVSTAVTSPTSTPTPSPSVATTGPNVRPGEKPPVLPDLATHNSRAGATTFATYWFQALDWGYATTDATLVTGLSDPSCRECSRLASILDRARSANYHFRGGRISQTSQRVADVGAQRGASAAVDVTYSQQALAVLNAKGAKVGSAPGLKSYVRRLWLAWSRNSWIVVANKQVVRR